MAQDLGTYLDLVRRKNPADVISVTKEVDPAFELTATVVKLQTEARKRPVLTFENVTGSNFAVLTNLHASRSRLAIAMNAEPREMLAKYLDAIENPIPPQEVNMGPSKDVILTGDDVDLSTLPQIVHHHDDAGAYITSAISFAKDPESEMWNCAYNRLMITGRNTTSVHLTVGKHLWEYYKIAEARGEALPVVFAIGVHPAIALGCLAIGSIDEDERGIMGALLGEPLELVRCETIDLLAPAMPRSFSKPKFGPMTASKRVRLASSPATVSARASARWSTLKPSPIATARFIRTSPLAISITCSFRRCRWRPIFSALSAR